jgi:hypothetical protein
MSDKILRRQLIRLASTMPKGTRERQDLLHLLASEGEQPKVAASPETTEFVDWAVLNMDPWSERALETYVSRLLKRDPTPYEKKTVRRGPLQEGEMVMAKPEGAPPQNEAMAEQYKYQVGTIERDNADGVLVRFENGQLVQFFGNKSGKATGLFRHTPKETYGERGPSTRPHVEFVYWSKPGEADQYRKDMVKRYKERGESRGEDRKSAYYSGEIIKFAYSKDGNLVVTCNVAQRPYPVGISAKKGKLFYFGLVSKRPNFKADLARDVAELVGD